MTGKGMVTDTKKDAPFWVRNFDVPPEEAPPIKMEVRGSDCAMLLRSRTAACATRMCQQQQNQRQAARGSSCAPNTARISASNLLPLAQRHARAAAQASGPVLHSLHL
jgi:hypothetical protein